MDILTNIFYFLLALFILIAIHEAGHFFMARLCGVYVERFSLGFGPVICSVHDKKGTEYSLSLIPLGGYVKMYGEKAENDGVSAIDPAKIDMAFSAKKIWQKFLIVFAGPLCNFLLAWVLYSVIFCAGIDDLKPAIKVFPNSPAATAGLQTRDLIKAVNGTAVTDWEDSMYELLSHIGEDLIDITVASNIGKDESRLVKLPINNWDLDPKNHEVFKVLGFEPLRVDLLPEIGFVEKNSVAVRAGLREGDKIISYDGKPYSNWEDFTKFIKTHGNQSITIVVSRDDIKFPLDLIPSIVKDKDGQEFGYAGIAPRVNKIDELFFTKEYSLIESIYYGAKKTVDMSVVTVKFIYKFITGDISHKNISGPIGIAQGAGKTAELGVLIYLSFIALISVNLGVLNLIPIPCLDGSHLLFYVIEGVTGKALSPKIMNMLLLIGVILLVALMALAIYNDLYYLW
jgi:regulator of sigma E protease